MPQNRGKFIVIEGIDGAGTTTQTKRLVDKLNEESCSAVSTFEPSDGPIGSLIRQMLSKRIVRPVSENTFEEIDTDTLTLLFAADRMDHLKTQVLPSLDKGLSVVSDRYYYSTFAYQGVKGDLDLIEKTNKKADRPDLVVFLEIDPKDSLSRIGNRTELSIFEKVDFLEKVSKNYEICFNDAKETIVRIDATKSEDEIAELIWQAVSSLFKEK